MTRMRIASCGRWLLTLGLLCAAIGTADAKPVHHYVFFGLQRDAIRNTRSFLDTRAFEGAQITYTWASLEPEKDRYDFSAIRDDLAFLNAHGKKLFVQLQDLSFMASRINVPSYLLKDPAYGGGAAQQRIGDDEQKAVPGGWAARRWDPAVRERFERLLTALGKEFDGRIEGINLTETSIEFGESGRYFPSGFSAESYRDGIIANMQALKRAFPKSVALEYANFMPGEWRPSEDKGYLRAVYDAAKRFHVGVGGPDLVPFRRGHLGNSYPLIHEVGDTVPVGIAVQDGNYGEVNRATGKRATIAELIRFATDYLHADYIFWCTEEPYYSDDLVPFMRFPTPSNQAGEKSNGAN